MNLQLKGNAIKIEGKINSSNVSDFEEQLWKLIPEVTSESNSEIRLDFGGVESIFAAGLRVLLKLVQKKYTVTIQNVGDEVYGIFDVTGFTQLLNVITKTKQISFTKTKQLSIDGCELIGSGATSHVYKINDELIIKVFNKEISREVVERERLSCRTALINGVPTAIPFEIVDVNGQYGLLYERLNGMTLGQAFLQFPDKFDELIAKYVELVKNMKKIEVVNGKLNDTREIIEKRFARITRFLSDEDVKVISGLFDLIPHGKTFVHGDLHPGNIMIQNDELFLIDMMDGTIGPDYFDFVQIYLDLYSIPQNRNFNELSEKSVGMKIELINKVWDAFIRKYLEGASKEEFDGFLNKLQLLSFVFILSKIEMFPDEVLAVLVPAVKDDLIKGAILPNLENIKKLLVEKL